MSSIHGVFRFGCHMLMVATLAACDGGSDAGRGPVDVHGASTADAVDALTDAACEFEAECGRIRGSCETENGKLMCTNTIVKRSYDDCHPGTRDNVEAWLGDCQITDEIADLIEDCLSPQYAECITQEQLDEVTRQLNAGEEVTAAPKPPKSCKTLDEKLAPCTREEQP